MINDRITELIPEIKKKAMVACEQSKGTPAEKIACAANLEIQKWQIGDQEQTTRNVENLVFTLTALVPSTPEYKEIRDKIKEIRDEKNLTKQLDIITILIPLISKVPKKSLTELLDVPAALAAFVGFLVTEFGTYYFQTSYNHLISVFIALLVFIIVALLNKR